MGRWPNRRLPGKRDAGGSARAQIDLLLRLVTDAYQLFNSGGRAWALDKRTGRALEVERSELRRLLGRNCYREAATAAASQVMARAIETLAARACFDGPERAVALRVDAYGDSIYVDLGEPRGAAVEITRSGWRIVDTAPVLFCKPSTMRALPRPERGATLRELASLFNVASEADAIMLSRPVGYVRSAGSAADLGAFAIFVWGSNGHPKYFPFPRSIPDY